MPKKTEEVGGRQSRTHREKKTRYPGEHARPSGPRARESGRGGNESRDGPRHEGREDGTLYHKRARQAKGNQGARDRVTYGPKDERVVVKIFGHKRKPEGGERIGAVQRRHIKGIGRLA